MSNFLVSKGVTNDKVAPGTSKAYTLIEMSYNIRSTHKDNPLVQPRVENIKMVLLRIFRARTVCLSFTSPLLLTPYTKEIPHLIDNLSTLKAIIHTN